MIKYGLRDEQVPLLIHEKLKGQSCLIVLDDVWTM